MWFWVSLLGYFLLSVVFILDKLILTENVAKSSVYTFYSTIFLLPSFVLGPFITPLVGSDWIWAATSGITFGLALWTLYEAVSIGEASHINPFNGAVVSLATFLFSSVFLGEVLSSLQLWGLGVLVIASVLLSFEESKKFHGFHIGFVWAALSGILFAASHVSAKYIYDNYDFLSGIIWTRAFISLVGIGLLVLPSIRQIFYTKQDKPKKKASYSTVTIVTADKIAGILGVILIQYASSIGNATPVFAISGIQYAMMFIMIFALTKLAPKKFKEVFTQKEILVQTMGIALVIIGSALFVI